MTTLPLAEVRDPEAMADVRAYRENPHRVGTPLRDAMEGLYSARRGDHRVIYEIHEHRVVVRVVRVQHRRDAHPL